MRIDTIVRLRPVAYAAIEHDFILCLVIQIFSDSYDVVFSQSCPYAFVPYPANGILEVYEDMVKILPMMWVFLAEDPRLNICSVVLIPVLKPVCSSAMISSACGWSLG